MTRDEELAQIREMMNEYKSMPYSVAKIDLYHRIEMKMKTCDMKYRYR